MRIAICSLCLFAAAALAGPPVIRPPPAGHWVTDTTGKVSAGTLAQLDAIAQGVEASGGGQLGVCVTSTTGGQVPRSFATALFNRWGIGHAGRDDGMLLFVALSDRKAEIVLGTGSNVTSSQTDVVMANDVVANLKRGQVDQGLIAAATTLAELMKADESPHAVAAPQVDEESWASCAESALFPTTAHATGCSMSRMNSRRLSAPRSR